MIYLLEALLSLSKHPFHGTLGDGNATRPTRGPWEATFFIVASTAGERLSGDAKHFAHVLRFFPRLGKAGEAPNSLAPRLLYNSEEYDWEEDFSHRMVNASEFYERKKEAWFVIPPRATCLFVDLVNFGQLRTSCICANSAA